MSQDLQLPATGDDHCRTEQLSDRCHLMHCVLRAIHQLHHRVEHQPSLDSPLPLALCLAPFLHKLFDHAVMFPLSQVFDVFQAILLFQRLPRMPGPQLRLRLLVGEGFSTQYSCIVVELIQIILHLVITGEVSSRLLIREVRHVILPLPLRLDLPDRRSTRILSNLNQITHNFLNLCFFALPRARLKTKLIQSKSWLERAIHNTHIPLKFTANSRLNLLHLRSKSHVQLIMAKIELILMKCCFYTKKGITAHDQFFCMIRI